MEDKRPEVAKKIVLEFLDFMKYKVEMIFLQWRRFRCWQRQWNQI